MRLRKQIAKPRKDSILLSTYDACPLCGGPKRDVSVCCQKCYWLSGKSAVPISGVFYVDKKPCRYIPLTKGQSTIVSAHRYKELSQWHWYALKNKFGRYYAARSNEAHKIVYMHRYITGGRSPETDHKNGNGLDNRDDNLRPCTSGQNKVNKERKKNSQSGFKGVYPANSKSVKWVATIGFKHRYIYLGSFISATEAARVYDAAARKYYGEFARTNFHPSGHAGPASITSQRA